MNRTFITAATLAILMAAGRFASAAEETNSATKLDLQSFKLISERNIFNPNRSRGGRVTNLKPVDKKVTVDSFTLCGIMSYENQAFAFFDGSSSEFRKALKPADTIAGYKIAAITPDSVKLAATNNQTIEMRVLMQMKREDQGPWSLVARAEPSATSAGSGNSDPVKEAAPSAEESDVIKRLMKKREQEN